MIETLFPLLPTSPSCVCYFLQTTFLSSCSVQRLSNTMQRKNARTCKFVGARMLKECGESQSAKWSGSESTKQSSGTVKKYLEIL
jgi:hypothetical protein